MARAIEDGLITVETSVLDYGCGRGGDVERLTKRGITCTGYDPVYRPTRISRAADVTNLGYVVNVIEDERERRAVLQTAWDLTGKVLVVSARLEAEAKGLGGDEHADGWLTTAGTFQKFFTQHSLREFVERTLERTAIAAAPGVFYVFRTDRDEQRFLLRRVRRALPPRSSVVIEENGALVAPLIGFLEERGRLPRGQELVGFQQLEEALGSVRNAFAIIRRVTGDERWDRIRVARSEDLLVFLALSRFGKRPRISAFPQELQYDIRDLFGSYKAACAQGDRLLFAISDEPRVNQAFEFASVGKLTRDAFYVHKSAVPQLPPVLRVLDGCAQAVLGAVDEATLVKYRRDRASLSYLSYPEFDEMPHPALRSAYTIDLQSLRADFRDYSAVTNPPVLHRKELFVGSSYPLRKRFERLTAAEVRAGLYRHPEKIGTARGWAETLEKHDVELRGHRVVRRSAVRASADTTSA
jgi:DNA phosphorothioation-associated putative methyltransferase